MSRLPAVTPPASAGLPPRSPLAVPAVFGAVAAAGAAAAFVTQCVLRGPAGHERSGAWHRAGDAAAPGLRCWPGCRSPGGLRPRGLRLARCGRRHALLQDPAGICASDTHAFAVSPIQIGAPRHPGLEGPPGLRVEPVARKHRHDRTINVISRIVTIPETACTQQAPSRSSIPARAHRPAPERTRAMPGRVCAPGQPPGRRPRLGFLDVRRNGTGHGDPACTTAGGGGGGGKGDGQGERGQQNAPRTPSRARRAKCAGPCASSSSTFVPEAGAQCVSSARWDLCGGRPQGRALPRPICVIPDSAGPAAPTCP